MDANVEAGIRDADRVYDSLRGRILSLNLAPGSVLDEARIVQDIGTSRTPVREAVIRLVSEGLLKRDGRQVVVPTFQIAQLRAFFEALTLLTRATHRMAAERHTAADMRAIHEARLHFEAEVRRHEEGSMNDANHAFHRAISHAADNLFLQESYDALLLQSSRLSRICFVVGSKSELNYRDHIAQILAEHVTLCDAIERRDLEATDRLATAHIDRFRSWLSDHLLGSSIHAAEMSILG